MPTLQTGSLQGNGLEFHYLSMSEGPLALCLHGFPDHAHSFRFQLPALAAAGYRTVAPFLRGYAPTEVPANGPYPAEDMESLKATFRQPGVLQAALGYYRHTFNPALQLLELAPLQEQMFGATPIHVPSLYFHGAQDGCIGAELSEGMEALFTKGVHKVIVPDAGHFVHQEKPEVVNQQLIDFLAT